MQAIGQTAKRNTVWNSMQRVSITPCKSRAVADNARTTSAQISVAHAPDRRLGRLDTYPGSLLHARLRRPMYCCRSKATRFVAARLDASGVPPAHMCGNSLINLCTNCRVTPRSRTYSHAISNKKHIRTGKTQSVRQLNASVQAERETASKSNPPHQDGGQTHVQHVKGDHAE